MPGMDGFEVCRRLKAETRTRHIPVIMVTALDQPADRVRRFEAGANDFLTKPVDDVALVKRVRNLARLKMLTDEMLMRASTEERSASPTTCISLSIRRADTARRGQGQLLPAHSGRAQGRVRAHPGGRSCKCTAAASRRQFRSHHRKPQPAGCRRLASMLAGSLARPDTPFADPDHCRTRRRCASAQGPGHGGQRLRGTPDRPERVAGEGAHPAQTQALCRSFAATARIERRDGHPRPAHRAA
jgi:CheY-like chemotaxis protein